MAQDLDKLVIELSEANGFVPRKEKIASLQNTGRQSVPESPQDFNLRAELDAIRQILKSLQSEAILRAELDGAKQLIKALQDQIKDLRTERDRWRQRTETTQPS